jgi:hypothetical protein
MNSANDLTLLIDDLAGHWTESVLAILKSAGIYSISVDMEVEAWRTLRKVLCAEFRWQRSYRFSTFVPSSVLMEQALRKAALWVAEKFAPQSFTYEFESRISQFADDRRSTAVERKLYSAIFGRRVVKTAFQEPGRAGFVRRERVTAGGG